jgi:catechol 2,3-dioxygenase-like lactoylglutathione lyase family enzyme
VFDHVTIRVADREASEAFYDTVLTALEIAKSTSAPDLVEWNDFSLAPASSERPPTRRLHVGFAAASRRHVVSFWRAGVEAGHRDDGPPGPRPEYGPRYYGGFLLDPDGNSAEAVHNDGSGTTGNIDHLWIRVSDLGVAKRFYQLIAPFGGFALARDMPGRALFRGAGASFSLVEGAPTENVHVAFPADDDAVVQAFHAEATGSGYRDNGAPGERPVYHPGYYAAFVLDPAGNNIEVVNHHR